MERTYFDVTFFAISGLVYISSIFVYLVIPKEYDNIVEVMNERSPIDLSGEE